jgi:hypothetical protein
MHSSLREPAGQGAWILASVALVANLLQLAGVYWDVGWHHARHRDTFWSPPHLAIYAGVALALAAAAIGSFAARQTQWRTFNPAATRDYHMAALGPLIQIAAAPIDELWHRVIGPDVSVWSPPHLLGILGGIVGVLGWALVLARHSGTRDASWCARCFTFAFTVLLLTGTLFALGEYDHDPVVREPWLYPALTGLLVPWVLVAARNWLGWAWGGTLVSVGYTVLRLALAAGVWGMGLPWLGLPPVIVVGAVLLDTLAQRRGAGMAGAVFGLAFTLSDSPLTYLLSDRAWSILEWAGTLPAAAAAGWASGLAGQYVSFIAAGGGPGYRAGRRRRG